MSFIKFNIKTRRTPHFFRVYIFDTKKEMNDYYDKHLTDKGEVNNYNWAARCCAYVRILVHKDGSQKTLNDIGTLLFYKDKIGSGISSHEIFHATLHYAREVLKNESCKFGDGYSGQCKDEEEDAALANGDLNRSFTIQCYKHKIYK